MQALVISFLLFLTYLNPSHFDLIEQRWLVLLSAALYWFIYQLVVIPLNFFLLLIFSIFKLQNWLSSWLLFVNKQLISLPQFFAIPKLLTRPQLFVYLKQPIFLLAPSIS
jgi:hypothetical protein